MQACFREGRLGSSFRILLLAVCVAGAGCGESGGSGAGSGEGGSSSDASSGPGSGGVFQAPPAARPARGASQKVTAARLALAALYQQRRLVRHGWLVRVGRLDWQRRLDWHWQLDRQRRRDRRRRLDRRGRRASGAGGATSTGFCPAGAIFCADFEEASGVPATAPVGTATFEDPTETGATFGGASGVMVLDTDGPLRGHQSLRVNPPRRPAPRTWRSRCPRRSGSASTSRAISRSVRRTRTGSSAPAPAPSRQRELRRAVGAGRMPIPRTRGDALPDGTRAAAQHGAGGQRLALPGRRVRRRDRERDGVRRGDPDHQRDRLGAGHEAFNTFELGTFVDNPNSATVWYDDVVVSSMP